MTYYPLVALHYRPIPFWLNLLILSTCLILEIQDPDPILWSLVVSLLRMSLDTEIEGDNVKS